MIVHTPGNAGSFPSPEEVADQLATQLVQTDQFDDDIVDRVRTSDAPLAVPIKNSISRNGSLRGILQYCVFKRIQSTDDVSEVSFSKVDEEKRPSIITHPSLLEKYNRLLPQAALAKTYQYGYCPGSWYIVQGGLPPDQNGTEGSNLFEKRKMDLVWRDEQSQHTFEPDDNWFADTDAVTGFAARVTDDDVKWAQYIPWYRSTSVSRYRLTQVAHTTDWTEFPDLPDVRPKINDRFGSLRNPRVGDFIRMAVLRKLEQHLPVITDLSTGPDPWETNNVSLVVDPTAAAGHSTGAVLCPPVALKKLAAYGYRPIDGWYDSPVIGEDADDPIEPRRIEFARGRALREWYQKIQIDSPLFTDRTQVVDIGPLPDIDWETYIPCVRSQIITYQQLHDHAHEPETFL